MKSKLQALADALRLGEIELVLAQDMHGYWDLSALHKNAGNLSTLYCGVDTYGVVKDGQESKAPKSGMQRRVKR